MTDERKLELAGHVVVCNWTPRANRLVQELHAEVLSVRRPIVIISRELANGPTTEDPAYDDVYFIPGDPTEERVLRRAGIPRAYAAVILADPALGEHADSRSILIALAIESLEPRVHTCIELLDASHKSHVRHLHIDEVVCVDELSDKLLAQSCLTPGLSELYLHLLTATEDTNEVYVVPVPERFVGRSYGEVSAIVAADEAIEAVVVGLVLDHASPGRRMVVNPRSRPASGEVGRGRNLEPTDGLVVLAYRQPTF